MKPIVTEVKLGLVRRLALEYRKERNLDNLRHSQIVKTIFSKIFPNSRPDYFQSDQFQEKYELVLRCAGLGFVCPINTGT